MAINVDLSATDRPDQVGEFQRVAAGPVHCMVIETKENGGKQGEHLVKSEILMHSDQTQIGLTHTEYYPATPEMAWKLLGFAYAVKIADREQMAAQKASGNNYAPIDLQAAVGKQFFGTIKVSEKTKDGKVQSFHNLDSPRAIDDPKAERHPRNVGMLQEAMKGMPPAATTAAATAAATTSVQQKPTASPAPAANPFAAVT